MLGDRDKELVVDAVVLGNVMFTWYYHHDWMMLLFAVPKFGKINLNPKHKTVASLQLVVPFFVKIILASQQLEKIFLHQV